jgi:hypothetical protein
VSAYGADQSHSAEGQGITLVVLGLVVWVAGWAYLDSPVQMVTTLAGLAGMAAGVKLLAGLRQTK